ncbi:hypothetical protein PHYBLDRAFT_148547 [Phycomyces blakesleeanus NRRL 1555(-)]|uniref:Uncharacterized protein n=1 Tax=Phycomyces blakesleeanus (strain ATCC 8743b / DSM 1359 / FGSC 10004 / NBRC 33097 / NRRL 1555) TaxID=763407 RepID=A0A163A2K2_PHYB8|nr:hypothetical protein PHYBLDRAFT_148547 [Phycomyces blakesleeanus NRRL 1555(-)]OAD70631.1 hypothetical protein PHYBLDRAFT_148547 [Phycomyces blakesleeanus NRRL 1555(-)]|eukprot:XP_018288671.1 hypothetical protein PHYBLDRAFT_148547 [Phycomyces blakesleeanus NRRL 1555(-)]
METFEKKYNFRSYTKGIRPIQNLILQRVHEVRTFENGMATFTVKDKPASSMFRSNRPYHAYKKESMEVSDCEFPLKQHIKQHIENCPVQVLKDVKANSLGVPVVVPIVNGKFIMQKKKPTRKDDVA